MSQVTLDLDYKLANKLNSYIHTYGSKELFFEKFINFQKKELKREINRIQIDLTEYEKKYKLTSKDFYTQFENGQIEDEKDYILWAGIYELQKLSKEKLLKLA